MGDIAKRKQFKTPGEYVYDGVTLGGYVNRRVVEYPGIVNCHEDDVFVVSYPKAGTTWALEMISLVMNGCDVDANQSAIQQVRHPMIETSLDFLGWAKYIALFLCKVSYYMPKFIKKLGFPDVAEEEFNAGQGIEQIERVARPRLLKSHLPYQFFPTQALEKKCKIIYIVRNPKDTAVSYYYHYRLFHFVAPWNDFYNLFINDNVSYGSWFDHVLGWWKHKDESNILYLKYEDMKKNFKKAIQSVASFLDKTVSDEEVIKIMDFCKLQKMKENAAVNMERFTHGFGSKKTDNFIRKGIIGDWENHFTVAQNVNFEKLYEERMAGTGLDFDW
ncbi:sulfotransferase 1B1-like [Ptychodera flava]|uniref:sulfotransferase 1B1-like n=1 Tax=Ptychodera flava TaxID=63121 RepID=UPI00396A7F5E